MRILTADDDAVCRCLLTTTLRSLGHEVVETRDGQEAWARFKTEQINIVISDWMMPGIDGLELCKLIRAEPKHRYTYLILLTSQEGRSKYLEGMHAGADDFLTKPFDRDTLASRLRVAERIINLQTEVDQLEQLLPICTYCKKIRDEENKWQHMEVYLSHHSELNFSHGVCPHCYEFTMLPQLEEFKRRNATRETAAGQG